MREIQTPLWTVAFRPLFLGAGITASLLVPLWLLSFAGVIGLPSHLGLVGWHAHEMLFGYTAAVIAGFMLTATSNWTRLPTLRGRLLALVVVLWVIARIMMWCSARLHLGLVAVVQLSFLPAVALACALPIVRSRNWRNLGLVALLLMLAACNAVMLLSLPVWRDMGTNHAAIIAMDVILMVIGVIAGRIIPNFTRGAIADVNIRPRSWIDTLSLVILLALLGADVFMPKQTSITGSIALAAGMIHALRMRGWGTSRVLGQPILWVLHLGYAWLALGLVLRGVALLRPELLSHQAALHALSMGSIGTLTLGMMARVSLGHTGRRLVFARPITFAVVALTLGVIVRIIGGAIQGATYLVWLAVAGALWTIAFALFTTHYAPILLQPRLDSKPG